MGLNSNYDTALTYKAGVNNSQTALLATYQNGGDTPYSYEYDANGNITEITQGNVSVTYSYNAANELIRENNGFTNQTVTYTYDNWGNITQKDVYAYTTGDLPTTPTQTIPYAYTNSSWGDQLTSYNNQSILYDAMGNPTSYLGQTLTWRGKQLTAAGTTTYEYDENGLRLNKTVNNVSTDYYYNGSVLMSLVTGNDTLLFSYDASGKVVAVNHNGTYYYYLRNGQGDIVKLIDNSGATVVAYTYDTWGKKVQITGTLASTLGQFQPFRYRGYVYDEETGLYYLQSRYYDPTTCRFISADVLLSTGQGVLGHNCYAYCGDNPVSRKDSNGASWEDFWEWLKGLFGGGNSCGGNSTTESNNPYGAAKPYVPSESIEYNCYAYALGETEWKYVGGSPNAVTNYDVEIVAEMVLEDAKIDGRKIRRIDNYDSPIANNEYRIALATGSSDYHFMVQHSDGSWSHKPSFLKTRLIEGNNPNDVSWDLPICQYIVYNNNNLYYIEKDPIKDYYNNGPVYFAVTVGGD